MFTHITYIPTRGFLLLVCDISVTKYIIAANVSPVASDTSNLGTLCCDCCPTVKAVN